MPAEMRDKLKPRAIQLRKEGWTYREIAGSLNISISTCSLWLRDVPAPPRQGYDQERVAAMWKSRWESVHIAREKERQEVKLAACAEVGEMDDLGILVAGALIYWCEGAKEQELQAKRVRIVHQQRSSADRPLSSLARRSRGAYGAHPVPAAHP